MDCEQLLVSPWLIMHGVHRYLLFTFAFFLLVATDKSQFHKINIVLGWLMFALLTLGLLSGAADILAATCRLNLLIKVELVRAGVIVVLHYVVDVLEILELKLCNAVLLLLRQLVFNNYFILTLQLCIF